MLTMLLIQVISPGMLRDLVPTFAEWCQGANRPCISAMPAGLQAQTLNAVVKLNSSNTCQARPFPTLGALPYTRGLAVCFVVCLAVCFVGCLVSFLTVLLQQVFLPLIEPPPEGSPLTQCEAYMQTLAELTKDLPPCALVADGEKTSVISTSI